MIHSTYEGLSKTSQTELLTKCVHAFAIGSCALPNGPILSLCNGLSTFDTAGTDFLKLCVGRSTVLRCVIPVVLLYIPHWFC